MGIAVGEVAILTPKFDGYSIPKALHPVCLLAVSVEFFNHGAALCTLRICTLGFRSLGHGRQQLVRAFETPTPRVSILRIQT